MSSCIINNRTSKEAIENKVISSLMETNMFEMKDDKFVPTVPTDYQIVIDNINDAFGEKVLFSKPNNSYSISVSDTLANKYFMETEIGKEVASIATLFSNPTDIDSLTYDKLVEFVKNINPKFNIALIDDLSTDGLTELKQFLISLRTKTALAALPEEVAHVVIELLPEDSQLKKDLLSNIISYSIYSQTLQQYKDKYIKNGKPDYDKIKREAAAKLLGEYITSVATGNTAKIQELTKQKGGFIKNWVRKFLAWLGINLSNNLDIYQNIAENILSGKLDVQFKTEEEIAALEPTDSYFYRLTDDVLYLHAEHIVKKKPNDLLEIVERFSKEFGKKFNAILKEEKFADLNRELMRNKTDIGKINKLTEINQLLKDSGMDLKKALTADTFLIGVKQFLEAVDSLDILSTAIYNVVISKEKSKDFNEAINNIKELEGYMSIYELMKNIIDKELVDSLVEANVGREVIDSLTNTKKKFEDINRYIISQLRNDLFIFFKENLSGANKAAVEELERDIAVEKARSKPSKTIITKLETEMKELVETDEKILDMLHGRGKDTDGYSFMNHLLNAAIMNGDLYISSISKFINHNIEVQQNKAATEVLALYNKIDTIQKKLGETAEQTGEKITFIDTIYDRFTGKTRDVLVWLNPHKNIQVDLEKKREARANARKAWYDEPENSPEKQNLLEEYNRINKDYNDFLRMYYNRPFVQAYYDFQRKYEENPVFISAKTKYDILSVAVKEAEEALKVEPENEENAKFLALKLRERANMMHHYDLMGREKAESEKAEADILKQYFEESGNFKEIDLVQTERSFMIAKNRYEQKVDFAIQQIRGLDLQNIDEVEAKLKELLRDNRLRIKTLYNQAGYKKLDLEYVKDILLEKWEIKNKTIEKNEQFFIDEKAIMDELNELQQKGELSDADLLLKEAYEERRNLLYGSRDSIKQINPDSMDAEVIQRLNELEDEIEEIKRLRPKSTLDLNEFEQEDRDYYEGLLELINDPETDKKTKRQALKDKIKLEKKYSDSPKSKLIKELYNLLGTMSTKVPTQYYWDKMAQFIEPMAEYVKSITSNSEATQEMIDGVRELFNDFVEMIDMQDYESLDFKMYQSDLFEDFLNFLEEEERFHASALWFLENHKKKKVFDPAVEKYVDLKYARTSIYQYATPNLPEHKKVVYNRKFQKYRVKDEYRTGYNPNTGSVELKVGEHITNRVTSSGFEEFLPLTSEQGAPQDSPYINEKYYELKNSTDEKDKLRFEYLETLKEIHLKHQEMVDHQLRSWMNVPVMELGKFEEKKKLPETVKSWWDKARSVLNKNEAADAEAQAAGEDTVEEIDQMTYENIMDRIPKLGMSQRIPIERVSRDVLKSTAQFIFRAYEFEGRKELQPVMKALLTVLKSNDYKNNSNKTRTQIFEKIYSQKILQEVPDSAFNRKWMRRIASTLSANTALRLVADPIGGMVNFTSANVNNIIEAFAGKHINMVEYLKGNYLAGIVNAHLMADFRKKSNLSYYTLLFNKFDFIQGDFEEDLLDRSSAKDKMSSVRQWMMIPRKAGELMAQTAIGMGMLERIKVRNSIDNKLYPMHEIYKKEGNKLVLKEGFPQEYDPENGSEFLRIRDKIHRVNLELHGNYARINQSEASRYSLGKLAENMKRWFMPALVRRYGRESIDITFEELNEGYYRTTGRALRNIFFNLNSMDERIAWYKHFTQTPRYKQNLIRTAADWGQAALMYFTLAFLLGYDDDEKEKLKDNSWVNNVAILIMLRSVSETTSYIPIPPFGFQEMKRNLLSPFALPADAVSNMAAIGQLGMYQVWYTLGADGYHDDLYYKRDSGYWYSEKGDSKLFKYILRTAGHTGYTFNPDQFIKDFDNLQSRLK